MAIRFAWRLCGVLAAIAVVGPSAQAEVSTDFSGSVVVYPKVVSDDTRDTVIQLANTSNLTVHAWCFYINAAPSNPNLPPGPRNPRLWQVTDFHVWLSRQQPTHWVASQGRYVNPGDGFGGDGSGLDPGAIPPVPPGFEGELRCVQVSASGNPHPGNALKGEVVLRGRDGDVSKYNAVSILATDAMAGDNVIRLDNTPDTSDGEANSCYASLFLDHFGADAVDPVISEVNAEACSDDDCPMQTFLTLVPCGQDLENVVPSEVTVQFLITNEFENNFSFSTTVECWFNESLRDLGSTTGNGPFAASTLGTNTAFTQITPVGRDGGVIGVAEQRHQNDDGVVAFAAWDLQGEGDFVSGRFLPTTRFDATLEQGPVVDEIVIPEAF